MCGCWGVGKKDHLMNWVLWSQKFWMKAGFGGGQDCQNKDGSFRVMALQCCSMRRFTLHSIIHEWWWEP